jgi:hypothetical protein
MRLEALTVHILEQQLAESNIPSANLITIENPELSSKSSWCKSGLEEIWRYTMSRHCSPFSNICLVQCAVPQLTV